MNTIKFKYFVPSIAWAFFILIICILPKEVIPKEHFGREDLVVHFVSYALLAIFFVYGMYKNQRVFDLKQLISWWAIIIMYGFLIEILQLLLPINRTFSLEDFYFNAFGTSVLLFQKKLNSLFMKLNL